MKLRNKRTGEVDDFLFEVITNRIDLYRRVGTSDTKNIWHYNSLVELNEDWEDYHPTKTLIDNEEIREIIRAWADVNDAGKLKYNDDENSLDDIYRNTISFNMGLGLKDGGEYTITELCGDDKK